MTDRKYAVRSVELDVLRGIAIIGMFIFHFTFDLSYFGFIPSDTIYRPNWIIFQKLIAGTFIFISGVSLHLCHGSGIRWGHVKMRLLFVGGAAVLVSITTIFAFGTLWVRFGILHCILVCSISTLVLVNRSVGVILVVAIALGLIILLVRTPVNLPVAFQWLIETQIRHYSIDYSPVFPWIFVFICGILAAKITFVRNWFLPGYFIILRRVRLIRILALVGQKSLIIYLLHQPILILGIYIYIYLT